MSKSDIIPNLLLGSSVTVAVLFTGFVVARIFLPSLF